MDDADEGLKREGIDSRKFRAWADSLGLPFADLSELPLGVTSPVDAAPAAVHPL